MAMAFMNSMRRGAEFLAFGALACWVCGTGGVAGCATAPRREAARAAFDLPESDALLIEWRNCPAARPCMRGDWEGREFLLGFRESPETITGHLGTRPLELKLDETSVYAYGNQIIEMTYM